MFINEAPFEQAYPTIILVINNTDDQFVARQSYSVNEYYPESTQLMPSGVEIHISFSAEIHHPDAFGYEFVFE